MLHIAVVPSGLACGCVCPGCGAKLVAKKGKKQAHNFAHYSNRACRAAYETMLHRLAKQVIADRKSVRTPAVAAEYRGVKRVVRRATDFRLDEVVLEQWLDGMRPDIVARRTVDGVRRELLVEIKVAHACGPEKVALIRERRIATIEIDLSKVPRHASQQEMEDAIVSAPRQWLYNRYEEVAVEEMRREAEGRDAAARQQEEQRRRREEAKLKLTADRVVAAFRRSRAAGQRQTRAGYEHLARVRDAGLAEHVGIDIAGSACFAVPDQEWQAAIIDDYAIGKDIWYDRGFSTLDVVQFLRERSFLGADFPLTVSAALGSAVRAVAPHFRSPVEVVEAYLELLVWWRVLRRTAWDWHRDEAVSRAARERIREAIEGRGRAVELAEKLRDLLAAIPSGNDIDVGRWMETRHPGLADTPLTLVMTEKWGCRKLLAHLDRLKAMLEPGAAVEESLLGLPLQRQLADRREEHRLAEEERARQAEETKRRAAEKAKAAAEQRKKTIARYAVACLGPEDGTAWLARPSPLLSGVPVNSVQALTEAQYETFWYELSAELSRRASEVARQAAIREIQEPLRTEAGGYGDPHWVDFWMRSPNRLLGGRRPVEVCVDQAGLEECRKALRQERRRLRRA